MTVRMGIFQPIVFILLDNVLSLCGIAFFSPASHPNIPTLNYSFYTSALEYVLFPVLRSLFLLYIICKRKKPSKFRDHVTSTISMLGACYAFGKLAAYSEYPEQFAYPGLWILLIWNILGSVIFYRMAKLINEQNLFRFGQMEEESSTDSAPISSPRRDSQEDIVREEIQMTRQEHISMLMRYCGHQWVYYAIGFTMLIFMSAAQLLEPYYTSQILSSVIDKDRERLKLNLFMISMVAIISTVTSGLYGGLFKYASSLIARRIRFDLYRSLLAQDIAFYDSNKSGELISRLNSDCGFVASSISSNFTRLLQDLIMIIGTVVFMITISWRLTVVSFVSFPFMMYIMYQYGVLYDKLSEETQTQTAKGNGAATESLSSIRTVRAFAAEEKERTRFETFINNTIRLTRTRSIVDVTEVWVNHVFDKLILITVLAYGAHLVFEDAMTSSAFMTFLLYELEFCSHLYSITYMISSVMESVGASRKIFVYINRVPALSHTTGTLKTGITGVVELRNVTFAYPTRPNNVVLQSVSFSISAGERVALVGPSGSGKSSIVSLIEHFYEPLEGEIHVNGTPIREYDHEYYHSMVSLVSQEPIIFDCSIQDNIAYGYDGVTQEEIINAAKQANAHDFIIAMEKGYETMCGEHGIQMSGGQKQRIAIARAIIRKPSLLILDEATSALDSESERVVQEALERCFDDRSVFIIAHRLSTIRNADKIIVLEKGQIVQCGTHTELMQQIDGLYHTMVRIQSDFH